mmetsp:Transcript_118215/g.376831  ORF Transcript_118215/g.376831 Transcript_118215/m.376831 type:complete len:271 (-) Transcript_118215:476-1288(-)
MAETRPSSCRMPLRTSDMALAASLSMHSRAPAPPRTSLCDTPSSSSESPVSSSGRSASSFGVAGSCVDARSSRSLSPSSDSATVNDGAPLSELGLSGRLLGPPPPPSAPLRTTACKLRRPTLSGEGLANPGTTSAASVLLGSHTNRPSASSARSGSANGVPGQDEEKFVGISVSISFDRGGGAKTGCAGVVDGGVACPLLCDAPLARELCSSSPSLSSRPRCPKSVSLAPGLAHPSTSQTSSARLSSRRCPSSPAATRPLETGPAAPSSI